MNIFVLDNDPKLAAQMHLDKHVVKMIIEYAQLLSTAHRLRDGVLSTHQGPNTKPKNFYLLPGETVVEREIITEHVDDESTEIVNLYSYRLVIENPKCYGLTHANHPSAIWARETDSNYRWLYALFQETACEYTHRYGKIHKTMVDIGSFLMNPPRNIPAGDRTPFALAMGDEFKDEDAVQAYRNYYLGPKAAFARWTNRAAPDWFKSATKDFNVSDFERTRPVA
jgi:hypothetical protein